MTLDDHANPRNGRGPRAERGRRTRRADAATPDDGVRPTEDFHGIHGIDGDHGAHDSAAVPGHARPAAPARRPVAVALAMMALVGLALVGCVALVTGGDDSSTEQAAGTVPRVGEEGGEAPLGDASGTPASSGDGDGSDVAGAAGATTNPGSRAAGEAAATPSDGASADSSAADRPRDPSALAASLRGAAGWGGRSGGDVAKPGAPAKDGDAAAGDSAEGPSMILAGEVVQFHGEHVLVCRTGDGHGVSHLGVTAHHGATGAQTAAEEPALCGLASDVLATLMERAGDGDVDLASTAIFDVDGRHVRCEPIGRGAMRCAVDGDGGPLVTVWDEARR